MTGTDLDLTIQVTDEVIGIDDGSCVIPARLSTDIVRRLEPGAVTFADDGDHITISAARSTFKLQTYPVVEFPPVGKTSEPMTHLSESALGEAVRQVVRAASHDDGRPLLDGRAGVAGRRVPPHGGHRLVPDGDAGPARQRTPSRARRICWCRPGPSPSCSACPPAPSRRGPTRTGSAWRPAATRSRSGRATSRSARGLLEGRYPDYKQLIPDHYPNRLHLGKETFLAALRRVQLLVRDNTTPVRLAMRQGGVDLSVQSQDVGDAAETVDGDYSGEDLIIAFNPSYLIDGVEAVAGDEVIVETADASRAATVRGAEDDAFRYLLMPVRVS